MAIIDSNTTVSLTMPQLVGGLVTLVVGGGSFLGLIMHANMANFKDEMTLTRQAVQALQTSDKETSLKIRDTELKLVEAMGGLRLAIERLDGRFASFDGKLDGLGKSITELSARVTDLAKQPTYRPVNWGDTKSLQMFTDALKREGVETGKIVIVPIDGASTPIRP
jgi:hypothetical protein